MKERINKSNGNSSSESSGNNNKKETREKAKDFAKTVGEKI
jgi:hypothetical protein